MATKRGDRHLSGAENKFIKRWWRLKVKFRDEYSASHTIASVSPDDEGKYTQSGEYLSKLLVSLVFFIKLLIQKEKIERTIGEDFSELTFQVASFMRGSPDAVLAQERLQARLAASERYVGIHEVAAAAHLEDVLAETAGRGRVEPRAAQLQQRHQDRGQAAAPGQDRTPSSVTHH